MLIWRQFHAPERLLTAVLAFAVGGLITALTSALFEESIEKGTLHAADGPRGGGCFVLSILLRRAEGMRTVLLALTVAALLAPVWPVFVGLTVVRDRRRAELSPSGR